MRHQVPHVSIPPQLGYGNAPLPEARVDSAPEEDDFVVHTLAPPMYWPQPRVHEPATVDTNVESHRARRYVIGVSIGVGIVIALLAASAASRHRSGEPAPEVAVAKDRVVTLTPEAIVTQPTVPAPAVTQPTATQSEPIRLPPIVLRARQADARSEVIPIINQNLSGNDEAQVDDPLEREAPAVPKTSFGETKAEHKGEL